MQIIIEDDLSFLLSKFLARYLRAFCFEVVEEN